MRDKQVESLERHSHSFACLHELSPFVVREWHVWHGTPLQVEAISAASVVVAARSAGAGAASSSAGWSSGVPRSSVVAGCAGSLASSVVALGHGVGMACPYIKSAGDGDGVPWQP